MNKTEVKYKFIFPKYSKLSINNGDDSFVPTSDGENQFGEVRALCNACPERVITYDQLDTSKSLDGPAAWSDDNVWPSSKKNEIKHYIDEYLSMPKYFDLRNYWDDKPCQQGGMSLMVFHSPEIGFTSSDWTKFSSTYNGITKCVYCAIMVSSGDFFYSWNLPNEVLKKSGLRDSIVTSHFHSNWYLTDSERVKYFRRYTPILGKKANSLINREKGVFDLIYFAQGEVVPLGRCYRTINGETVLAYLHTNPNDSAYTDPNDPEYKEVYGDMSPSPSDPTKTVGQKAIESVVQTDTIYLQDQQAGMSEYRCSAGDTIGLPYYIYGSGSAPTKYTHIREDLKKDYIDLEVTRRILYYCSEHGDPCLYYPNKSDNQHSNRCNSMSEIPKISSGVGKTTILSFEPPQEYIDRPPLQIPYNLLRYTLNDRPPFSDCETVLLIWVADNDPLLVADNDIEALHNLNWQQYAIPLSVRCYVSDAGVTDTLCHDRFLVSYPHLDDLSTTPPYRFHIRRNEPYVKDHFAESLYLQGLIRHSRDNVIACRNTHYDSCSFSVQKFLFEHCNVDDKRDALKALYIKKQPRQYGSISAIEGNQQTQIYYLIVPKEYYRVNTELDADVYITDESGTSILKPSSLQYFNISNFSRWDFDGNNDWGINNEWFITIFDNSKIGTSDNPLQAVAGSIEFVNASELKASLPHLSSYNWDDIYLNSFSISPLSWINADSLLSTSISGYGVSLDYLHNHIKINGTVYGTATGLNNKVVVGFADVYDYTYSDYHHFRYDSITDSYKLVNDSNFLYIAYVLNGD